MDAKQKEVRRVVLASFVGTVIEWYDYFLFGTAAALIFGPLFFPMDDPYVSRMASLGAFAIGFFARPLGGVVFGHYGDRVGRKSMLVVSLALIGASTFLIGLLPTYQQIGVAAPILLVILRLIQGFGVGGEWGGAALMAIEHGHSGKRGFYGSCVQMGVPVGLLLATAAFWGVSRLPEESLMSWGWRIPFLLGGVLFAVGMFIRVRLVESPLFTEALKRKAVSKAPIIDVFRNHGKNVFLAMGARFAENACFYIFSVWILSYATERLGLERNVMLVGVWIAAAVQIVAIPGFGILSDRIGRRPVYIGGAIFMGLFSFPFFALVETKSTPLIVLAIVLGLIGHAAMYGPQAAFFSELFGTKVRYSGASIGYQLASPFAGGLAPLIATALVQKANGQSWPVSVYLIGMAVITLVSVYLAAETHRSDISGLDESDSG